jgi:pilus assembly protein Flp/PilA
VTKTKAVIALKRASIFARLWKDEAGQDLVEYALIAGFIGCGTVLGVHGLAAQVAGFINTVANGFSGDINGAI